MREILFRGKQIDCEKWLYGSYLNVKIVGQSFSLIQPQEFDTYRAEVVNPDTVGQYTEFKDSNGAKIFEGDILRCHYNCKDIKTTLCVCEQDKINPCFVLRNVKNEYDVEYDFVKCGLLDLEVIGNIYDNPELLKGE